MVRFYHSNFGAANVYVENRRGFLKISLNPHLFFFFFFGLNTVNPHLLSIIRRYNTAEPDKVLTLRVRGAEIWLVIVTDPSSLQNSTRVLPFLLLLCVLLFIATHLFYSVVVSSCMTPLQLARKHNYHLFHFLPRSETTFVELLSTNFLTQFPNLLIL